MGGTSTPDPRRWRALVVCLLAGFITLLDVSIVNVALPSIQRGLTASSGELAWVVAGYALTFGLVLVPAGRLGDQRGRRPMFLVAVGLFTATSALAGLALTATWLVVARLLQGVAAGMLNPQVVGLIQELFSGRERGRALGLFAASVGVSTAVGPLLGGVLLQGAGEAVGWRLVFAVNVPIGLVAMALAARVLPAGRQSERGVPLAVVGALLLGLSVVSLMYPLVVSERDAASAPWWLVGVAAVLLVVFVLWEHRIKQRHGQPLIDLALLRTRSYALGTALGLVYYAGFTSIFFVLTLFLQQGRGYGPLVAGLALTPFAVGTAITAALGGRAVSRLGRPLVIGGLLLVMVGLVAAELVLRSNPGPVALALAGPLLVTGLGSGLVVAPNQTLALAQIPPRVGGAAAGVLQTGQRVGSSMGIAAVGSVFFTRLAAGGDWSAAISSGLLVTVGFVGLALLIGLTDLLTGRSEVAAHPVEPTSTQSPYARGPEDAPGVRGCVVDGWGDPVPGACLTLVAERGQQAGRVDADTAGLFELEGLDADTYQLIGRAAGHHPAATWVRVACDVASDVALTLPTRPGGNVDLQGRASAEV